MSFLYRISSIAVCLFLGFGSISSSYGDDSNVRTRKDGLEQIAREEIKNRLQAESMDGEWERIRHVYFDLSAGSGEKTASSALNVVIANLRLSIAKGQGTQILSVQQGGVTCVETADVEVERLESVSQVIRYRISLSQFKLEQGSQRTECYAIFGTPEKLESLTDERVVSVQFEDDRSIMIQNSYLKNEKTHSLDITVFQRLDQ